MVPATSRLPRLDRGGDGSCILEAVAGAGKSTTIVEAATRIKGSSILIVFNAEPAKELQQKLAAKGVDWKKANAGTVHSYGLKAYRYTFKNFQVEENKVRNLVEEMIAIHHDEAGDRFQPYADTEPYAPISARLSDTQKSARSASSGRLRTANNGLTSSIGSISLRMFSSARRETEPAASPCPGLSTLR